jgi:hypothetical protein
MMGGWSKRHSPQPDRKYLTYIQVVGQVATVSAATLKIYNGEDGGSIQILWNIDSLESRV